MLFLTLMNPLKKIAKNPFVLAPMDNVTDLAFRELAEKNGALYTVSELTSVEALIRENVPKYRYMRGNLKFNCVQLFGNDEKMFKHAIEKIENEVDMIDINFGCPSPSLINNFCGAYLLKKPEKIASIINSVVKSTSKPISAKIRLGYDKKEHIVISKIIEDSGADLITVHGRTAKQKYSGIADWNSIFQVKSNVNIPVIGNGDILKEDDILDKIGLVDGIMIGRGAMGNSFIFKRLKYFMQKSKKLDYDRKDIQKKDFDFYLKRLDEIDLYKKDLKVQMQAMWFFKGIEGAKDLRINICKDRNITNTMSVIKKF